MQESNSQFNARSPILTTSLRIPQLHEGLITRPILMDRMNQVLDFLLTLITAPAGFGKTPLLIQWISDSQNPSLQDRVTWVSLEDEWYPLEMQTFLSHCRSGWQWSAPWPFRY